MKILITFALFVGVLADEVRVVNLPRVPLPLLTKPDIRPLIVPQHVVDAIALGQPILRDTPFEDNLTAAEDDLRVRFADGPLDFPVEAFSHDVDEGLEVHFVDAPVDVAAPAAEEIAIPAPVQLGEAPLPAFETAEVSASEMKAPESVKIAKPVMPAFEALEVAEPFVPALEAVKVAVPETNAPDAVMFVDGPLDIAAPVNEEAFVSEVRIAEAPLPAVETAEASVPEQYIEPVRIAYPRPGKQYADPRLR